MKQTWKKIIARQKNKTEKLLGKFEEAKAEKLEMLKAIDAKLREYLSNKDLLDYIEARIATHTRPGEVYLADSRVLESRVRAADRTESLTIKLFSDGYLEVKLHPNWMGKEPDQVSDYHLKKVCRGMVSLPYDATDAEGREKKCQLTENDIKTHAEFISTDGYAIVSESGLLAKYYPFIDTEKLNAKTLDDALTAGLREMYNS